MGPRMMVLGEGVATRNVAGFLPLEHHVRAADGVGLVIQLLAEDREPSLGVEVTEMVLGHREHPAGAAGGVVEGPNDARLGQCVLILDEEQVDHQPDHLARGEVLPSGLVGELREPADQLLVDVAHLQADVPAADDTDDDDDDRNTGDNPGAASATRAAVELLDDIAGGLGEASDVGEQVVGDIRGVIEQAPEGQRRGVVELLAGDGTEDRVHVLDSPGQLRRLGENGVLGRLEDAVEAANDGEGQDDFAVLGLLVVSTEQVGHRPDEAGVVADSRIVRDGLGCRTGFCPDCHLSYLSS